MRSRAHEPFCCSPAVVRASHFPSTTNALRSPPLRSAHGERRSTYVHRHPPLRPIPWLRLTISLPRVLLKVAACNGFHFQMGHKRRGRHCRARKRTIAAGDWDMRPLGGRVWFRCLHARMAWLGVASGTQSPTGVITGHGTVRMHVAYMCCTCFVCRVCVCLWSVVSETWDSQRLM